MANGRNRVELLGSLRSRKAPNCWPPLAVALAVELSIELRYSTRG